MKEIDDTDLPESESEDLAVAVWCKVEAVEQVIANNATYALLRMDELEKGIRRLELRVAKLETQRTPQDENDDPEWFS